MTNQLLINCTENGVFAARTENGVLTELAKTSSSWVGRVIVGRIKTILPGQFAFIDIGAKKNAFINLHKGHGLKAGQAVLVQVIKDAVGTKGMCVSLEIALRKRFAVLFEMKNAPEVGVSRKISDEKEARRLRKIGWKNLPQGFSLIMLMRS